MSDITASERRLSAALDRLDKLLDAGAGAPVANAAADDDRIAALTAERDAALAAAVGAVGDQDGPGSGDESGDLRTRLEAASELAARMSAANEDLITANRDLLEAQATGGIGPDEARAALEAEIAALRAARAAEMAQMSEIMAELERLLAGGGTGEGEPDPAPLALQGATGTMAGDADPSDIPTPKDEER